MLSKVTAANIMSCRIHTTAPETPLEEAARVMRDQRVGALPVVRDGRLVGLITESDIFRALIGAFELPQGGARITFDVAKGEDILGLISPLAQRRGVRIVSMLSAQHHDRPICVVRITGTNLDGFLEDLWSSQHLVLNVLRLAPHPPSRP